ncbi:MAG: peptigoglycan-binding protein LysM, partial [Alcanivorax sp.]
GHWQKDLPVGDYRLLVRAVDKNGLRGDEHWQAFSVTPAPPPEPVPEPAPEKESHWDLWAFVGAAALLLAL